MPADAAADYSKTNPARLMSVAIIPFNPKESRMSKHPASPGLPGKADRSPAGSTDTAQEYVDATETWLDHSKPPHHDKTAADKKHKDEPQISVGKP